MTLLSRVEALTGPEPAGWRWRFDDQTNWTVQKRKPKWYTPDQWDIVIEPLYAEADIAVLRAKEGT